MTCRCTAAVQRHVGAGCRHLAHHIMCWQHDMMRSHFLTSSLAVFCLLQIPAVWTQAPGGSKPDQLPAAKALARHMLSNSSSSISSSCSSSVSSSSSVSKSLRKLTAAVQQPVAAVARPPAKAVRRIVWDHHMQLRAFWLMVFFCVLGEQRHVVCLVHACALHCRPLVEVKHGAHAATFTPV